MERHRAIDFYNDHPQISSESFSSPLWQWQSGPSPDPWKEKDPSKFSWQPYSDSDSLIIEQAFSLHKDLVDLNDNYEIDLKKMLQVNKKDKNRIRRVRRQEKSRFMMEISGPEILPKEEKSFGTPQDFLEYLLTKAPEAYQLSQRMRKLPLDCRDDEIQDVIQEVLVSIEKAGELKEALSEAKSLVSLIRDKSKSLKDFLKVILKVYVLESFLCYRVNEVLRKENWQEISMFAPYLVCLVNAFKLREHVIRYQEPQGLMKSLVGIVVKPKLELYKGTAISREDVERLYNPNKIKYFSWKGITSVSQEKTIAMNFAKLSLKKVPHEPKVPVLFVIQGEYDTEAIIDVTQYSRFAEEKEVVLAPGTVFKLSKIRFTEGTFYEISLKITRKSEENMTLKSQGGVVILEGLPSQKSLKLLGSLKGVLKLEIRNSGIDENLLQEIANTNIKSIKLGGNTLVVSSLSVLAHYFGEENLDDLLMLNKIQFKETKDPLPNKELKRLNLPKQTLEKFQQLKPLWKDIKTLTQLTTLNISMKEPYRTDPNDEFFDMIECTSQFTSLENLTLALHRTYSPENFSFLHKTIASLTSLKQLSLQLILSKDDLNRLSNSLNYLTNLQKLSLNFENSYDLSGSDLHSLKDLQLKSLQSLSLNFTMCDISDSGLDSLLNNLTELRTLSLNFEYCNRITDKTLKTLLPPLTSLHTLALNFGKCKDLTDEGLAHLTNSFNYIKDLSLNFNECPNISDKGLQALKESFQNIYKLSLNFRRCKKISDIGLAYLSNGFNKSLQKLSLSLIECEKISDEGLNSFLNFFRFVQHLTLNFTICPQISDQGLKHLEQGISFMKSLQYLSLDFLGCERISDNGLNSIKNSLIPLADLQHLSLNFSTCNQITDEGLNHVISGWISLKYLRHLSLDFGKCYRITNKGLNNLKNALRNLPNLQDFSFKCTNSPYITDEGLGYLKSGVLALTSLRCLRISLWGCREISDEARNQFGKGLMPFISFEFD